MIHKQQKGSTILPSKAILSAGMFLLTFSFFSPMYCQVYNYSPINYNDIETNPAITASINKNNQIHASHQNSILSTNTFSSSTINFSKYFESAFSGLGLTLNNTNMNTGIHYNYIGLSAGYRNILFNKVHIRIGATYKVINTNSPPGSFDYYSFTSSGINKQKNTNTNLNLSLSFSTPSNKHFVSIGSLNNNLDWNRINKSIEFPTYYVFHLGNLMSLFDGSRRGSEISYTAFSKTSIANKKTIYSHYIDFKFILNLTRITGLKYGSRVGTTGYLHVHVSPFITLFNRKSAITLFCNFYSDKNSFQLKYSTTFQLSLIYNL